MSNMISQIQNKAQTCTFLTTIMVDYELTEKHNYFFRFHQFKLFLY